MPAHRNRVQMTVTGTPGTGTITLNAASSGYQTFATAYGGNATVDILIVDGAAWEVARNCTYTHAGTTLTRGTREESSTGSAISLTSAAVVSVIATADRGRTWDSAALEYSAASVTTADVTGAVNTLHALDVSGMTADRTFTLPATAAVGDRVGVMITAGDDAYELLITAPAGDTLDGVSGGTEWGRFYNSWEMAVFRCTVANSTWVCESVKWVDRPFEVVADGSTTQTMTRNTNTKATAVFASESSDPDALWDTTNKKLVARRAGLYVIHTALQFNSLPDQTITQVTLYKNGAPSMGSGTFFTSGVASPLDQLTGLLQLGVNDYVELYAYYEDGSTNRTVGAIASNNYFKGRRLGP